MTTTPPPGAHGGKDSVAEYRLDDLAHEAGTTVRSVRTYQESGLLPHPQMRGRVGWYSDAHLARLRLIARLQDRGYTFAAIGELLRAWETGRPLADVLGLDGALTSSLATEAPAPMTREQVRERFHGQFDDVAVARSVAIGVFEPEDSGYCVLDPAVVEAGARSVDFGIPMSEVLDLSETMYRQLKPLAEACVTMVAKRVLRDADPGGAPASAALEGATGVIDSLRAQSRVAVDGWFSRCMDEVISETIGRVFAHAAGTTSDAGE